MQSYLRATKTPNPQSTPSQDFTPLPHKNPYHQKSSKPNPQPKSFQNPESTQNAYDHGESYQTGPINSDMYVESLGSRNINPSLAADGCFSVKDRIRQNMKERPQAQNGVDVNQNIARERLQNFPLEDLCMTKVGKFDQRKIETKDYLNLCTSADVDPYEYYDKNLNKNTQPTVHNTIHDYHEDQKVEEDEGTSLQNFPLGSLKWSQSGTLDMTNKSCKEYVALCEMAGVHPLKYCLENLADEQQQQKQEPRTLRDTIPDHQPVYQEKNNKILRPTYMPQEEREEGYDSDKEAALGKLRDFPLNELWLTKKNTLDMRKNNTKDYMLLCDSAGVDPMDYYFENVDNPSNRSSVVTGRSIGESAVTGNSLKSSVTSVSSAESNLTLTKNNRLDKRFNSNRDFIKEKIAESQLKLSQFDTSQLKRRKDGELDKRDKVNKEYLELQEKTQEDYWQNVQFN